MTDKVVSFPGAEALPQNLIRVEDRDRSSVCRHERIVLDEHQRTVTCCNCARVLDPFGFLVHQAHLLQRAWQHHEIASRKVRELSNRIEVLIKEQKSLQGKVARLREKVPSLAVRGKDKL